MNLPSLFVETTRHLLGEADYERFVAALTQESPVSVRLNPAKAASLQLEAERVPWATHAYYLPQRPTFTFDPLFHAGYYYVQEASSMFVEQAMKQHLPNTPLKMLDLCAAPGGKSTHARTTLPEGSLLVSNEVMRNRVQILAENLTKWGNADVVVTNNDPADFEEVHHYFDVILTDVPCSGEGMFRKDAVAIEEWSGENVEICWQRQQRIIKDIWGSLKPGGLLIYSTCTYNTQEDEENVSWICNEFGAEVLPVSIDSQWQVSGSLWQGSDAPVYRFMPHRTRGEGFFLAALRKPIDEENDADDFFSYKAPVKKGKAAKGKKEPQSVVTKEHLKTAQSWLNDSSAFQLEVVGSRVVAIPGRFANDCAMLKDKLRVVQAGIAMGEVKGKDLIPDHALAMSNALKQEAFGQCDIDYTQAIAYLRKEAISLPETAPLGYVLVTYKSIPLGFVKNIGKRANNLYPQEWRIRSGYLPGEIKMLID